MSYDNPEKSIALISTRPLKKDLENIEPKNNYKFTIIDQPLSKITPLQDYSTFDSILESVNQFHHIVFISNFLGFDMMCFSCIFNFTYSTFVHNNIIVINRCFF